jgi:hypothetical protein
MGKNTLTNIGTYDEIPRGRKVVKHTPLKGIPQVVNQAEYPKHSYPSRVMDADGMPATHCAQTVFCEA